MEFANSEKLNPFWESVYYEMFRNIAHITGTINDIKLQKQGIDRIITLDNGRNIFVDEKIRKKNYDDICIEYLSSMESGTPGWIEKDTMCDYICYAFLPAKICYVLPYQILKRVWRYYKDQWIEKYTRVEAKNMYYTTISVAVPISVVMEKIGGAMKIQVNL